MKPLPAAGPGLLLRAALHRPGPAGVPELVVEHEIVAPDLIQPAYRAAFGFAAEAPLPVCALYLWAQRAQLDAMCRPDYPERIVGSVHASNRLQREPGRALQPGRPLQLRTRLRPEPGRDDGARWVQVEVEFHQDGQRVARGESRYLATRGARSAPVPRAAEVPPGELITRWALDAAAGRRYARLSGDWNPIHLWPATARLFGFRQPIIHGMHSAASVEAALDRLTRRPTQALSIEFKRPIPLGSEVELWADALSGEFALLVGSAVAARGRRR